MRLIRASVKQMLPNVSGSTNEVVSRSGPHCRFGWISMLRPVMKRAAGTAYSRSLMTLIRLRRITSSSGIANRNLEALS